MNGSKAFGWKSVVGKQISNSLYLIKYLAEREGFEPPVRFPVHLISSQAPSTGLGHLSAKHCGVDKVSDR